MPGFASKYGVTRFVFAKHHDRVIDAIQQEKRPKKWNRDRKLRLIKSLNPDWRDLTDDVL